MNAMAMLERCGRGQQNQEHDASLPSQYLQPDPMWRDQETLDNPPSYPLSCEDIA